MGYGRKRYEPKGNHNSTFGLNITSMTDMFTILLVFLLQTYSSSEVQIVPENNLRLPQSTAESNPVESIKVSVSQKELKIDGKVVATLQNLDFNNADIDSKDTNFILPLFKELEKLNAGKASNDKNQAAKDDKKEDGKLLLQADEALSYQVLRKVMYTASMAGFPKLKLATVASQ